MTCISLRGSVVVVILAAASSSAGAADLSPLNGPPRAPFEPERSDIVNANNQINLDLRDTDFGYTETGDGRLGTKTGKLDTETRWLPGLALSYSVMGKFYLDNVYFSAQASWDDGKTHYIGSKIGGVFGSVVTSDGATVWDTDFRLGKGFAIRPDVMLTPFLGMGTNSWDRRVNQGERYADDYFGAGLMVQVAPMSRLVLSASGLIGETFDSHIAVAGPFGFSGGLGAAPIVKLGLSGDYALNANLHVNAGVDYVTFRYGESASYPVLGGYSWEPSSRTANVTFKTGVGYGF
jgi:hypothetical protein